MTSQTTDLPQLLAGKRLLVTGVLTEASIAFGLFFTVEAAGKIFASITRALPSGMIGI